MLIVCVIGGAFIYPYTYVRTEAVKAAAFFQQFCIQGAWSVIPIYVMEISPGSFQTFMLGTAYQMGDLASSASSTIESTLGEKCPLPPLVSTNGTLTERYNYGKVIGIFMGAVYAYNVLIILIGPEKRGHDLNNVEHDTEMTAAINKAQRSN